VQSEEETVSREHFVGSQCTGCCAPERARGREREREREREIAREKESARARERERDDSAVIQLVWIEANMATMH